MSHPMKAYQRVKITTASPAELVALLFDGLVRFVGNAAESMGEGRYADAGKNFVRAQDIIAHLRESLDESVSSPVVTSLDRTYLLWAHSLAKAQLRKDVAAVQAICEQVLEMAAAWRIAAEKAGPAHAAQAGAR